ncbi:hypothetical protein BS47DRAFT_865720 [Hydnum rufescens UP504]|uniref:Uncharacterized protein n=1 Tax=Hydnum rufescens UP504 TaxID=1448309 RepID=A0A9P6DTS6_9AGAM|nr:hypothetical protein BS47DRAFT_865720 [Hydnum rufescens UP504]
MGTCTELISVADFGTGLHNTRIPLSISRVAHGHGACSNHKTVASAPDYHFHYCETPCV